MPGRRPEETRLSEALRLAYEAADVSQTQIADALPGIDQPTVSKWARGERPPPLWVLPVVDRLCGQPRGHVLRIAGYVEDGVDVVAAVNRDPRLDESARELMAHAYRYCVSVSKPEGDATNVAFFADAEIEPNPDDANEMLIWGSPTFSDEFKRAAIQRLRAEQSGSSGQSARRGA